MQKSYLPICILLFFTSCLANQVTRIDFIEVKECQQPKAYRYTSFFPFTIGRPFYKDTKDELELSCFLVLADSSVNIHLHAIQPYLIKNNDTFRLKEASAFKLYDYPGIVNEAELYIHFDYSVETKAPGKQQHIKEDFKLFRCKRSFRSVH